ncbi:MBL fold metallo-hydrolase [Candidatus Pacearchaeota archaeon]|nr:MBL fold metallo-hydrolase [Candidatus Pacearchaeota archaeon]
MKIENLELEWLGHAAVKIKNKKVIYIDPFQISSTAEKADVILITHSHYDHCSVPDINKIVKEGTVIVCTVDCQSSITKVEKKINMQVLEAGDKIKVQEMTIQAIPAYNPKKPFHTKEEGWVGYAINIENVVIYHAGDTDYIEEMKKLTGFGKKGTTFIALLPIGGKFTMNAEEAAQAASIIKPTIAIPIHYGSIIGSNKDAENFVKLCEAEGINAKILEKK